MGPWANDIITLAYDQLGRQVSRSINGTANQSSVTFDGLGRVQSQTNPLGVFGYAYVGATGRLDRIDYPNGQRITYAYFDSLGDQRLKQIKNLAVGGVSTLSQFDYTYDAIGQITSWTQHHSGAPSPQRYDLRYDGVDQLVGAILKKTTDNTVLKEHAYGYDNAGNRVQEQLDRALTTSQHNPVNQLTNQTSGGEMEFAGTVTEPASVTLGGKPATVDPAGNWRGHATVAPGNNSIPLVATDLNSNITTKSIAVTVADVAPRTLVYDLNGNLVDDGAGKTYGWDALNRLVKITQDANVTEFVYNGSGERVQEKLNGAVIKQWIWCGGSQPCEERDASNITTKRFYAGLGEQIGGASYFLTTDHLGSVREMTDSSGAVRARYSYDPYGRISKVSGDLESDFGFTGFYRHRASGLSLTMYREYDPELGRWLSRDPIGENGGLNLYAYVMNNPVNGTDPFGLFMPDTTTISRTVVGWTVRGTATGVAGAVDGFVLLPFTASTANSGESDALIWGTKGPPTSDGSWTIVDVEPLDNPQKLPPDPQSWMGPYNSFNRQFRTSEDECLKQLEKYMEHCHNLSQQEKDEFMQNCMKRKGFQYPP